MRIALLGAGTVGSSVARMLCAEPELWGERAGRPITLAGIGVRTPDREIEGVPGELFTTDFEGLVDSADLVIEVVGGHDPAGGWVRRALGAGTHVVTANKALIATDGVELHALARAHGARLRYEAAVGGAMPVVAMVADNLAGDRILGMRGIVNGSTNYVLTRMERDYLSMEEACGLASDLGYLEADPSADLDGHDAANKLAILARHAWGGDFGPEAVDCTGIREVTSEDVHAAAAEGAVIKLIARAVGPAGPGDLPTLTVRPERVPRTETLAGVHDGDNRVIVDCAAAGPIEVAGMGAGGDATASAVIADVLAIARATA
ncbi:homoserine dehydrogenase [Kytococcus aerolatus]|uniref:Homoserine dehydrogenase n=1 Tax=Kytococcus aerolatus TaxID=592308 RepID=A0A212TBV3_9MICO|nr:homoserine dehydrogenase [Kytococcus aerolatus]SNC63311.1 homoserine dehydrogenase [Kytococcus aerolatus]